MNNINWTNIPKPNSGLEGYNSGKETKEVKERLNSTKLALYLYRYDLCISSQKCNKKEKLEIEKKIFEILFFTDSELLPIKNFPQELKKMLFDLSSGKEINNITKNIL
jgi:hypothetical protein